MNDHSRGRRPQQLSRKRKLGAAQVPFKRHRNVYTFSMFLAMLAAMSSGMTYDNNPLDPHEAKTRHTKTKRKTHVSMEGLALGEMDPSEAAEHVMDRIGSSIQSRLAGLFEKAKSPECRAKIAEHFGYFVNALGVERSLPFQDVTFRNECPSPPTFDFDNPNPGRHLGMIQNKTYLPENGTYMDPTDMTFCYAIMTHQHPEETIRLVEALYEPGHVFVVHVDAKESSDETHARLKEYATTHSHIHILDHPQRVRVNWGGFSMVNATLQMLHYSFEKDLRFDKFVHLASTNYPLASNAKIRQTIAKYPVDANLVHIVLKPSRPKQASWHYFVECDDAVHRIYRLPPLINATAGVELYTSSQWFTLSREFARYLAYPRPETFVYEFLQYAQHVVVADETFFGTALLHSPYCDKHHNWNYVHLQFDQWENEIPVEQRDPKKCIMPDPSHCGRSPTTITMDYVDLLTLSDDLFARKFNDQANPDVKDILDRHREQQQKLFDDGIDENEMLHAAVDTSFEGHGVLIVAKATVNSSTPLCMGLGPSGNYAKLVPCFYEYVLPSLAKGWETGAVILEETPWHNRWKMGPCTPDGNLERQVSAEMKMTLGNYSQTGPRCMLTQMDGIREGRCLDGHSNGIEPGGTARAFPCIKRWPQFFSFGDGSLTPKGSLFTNVPQHIVNRIRESRAEEPPQEKYLCLGVLGRGDKDEEHLYDLIPTEDESDEAAEETVKEYDEEKFSLDGYLKLDHFQGAEIVATRCSNSGAVVEWLYVPFIVEEEELVSEEGVNMDKGDMESESESVAARSAQPACSNESCGSNNSPSTKQDDDDVKASL